MAQDDAGVRRADRARRVDVLVVGRGDRGSAHDARGTHSDDEPDDDGDPHHARVGTGSAGEDVEAVDQQNDRWYGQDDVDEALSDGIHPAAEVSGHGAQEHGEEHRDRDAAEPDERGNSHAVEDACEHVAARLVRAHPVSGGGAEVFFAEDLIVVAGRREDVRVAANGRSVDEDGDDEHGDDDEAADGAQRLAAAEAPGGVRPSGKAPPLPGNSQLTRE